MLISLKFSFKLSGQRVKELTMSAAETGAILALYYM